MSEQTIQGVNDGKPWSEMDLFDLRMGWEEEYVRKIIRRYIGRAAATQALSRQMNRKGP
jgi:hypothetical protein